MTALIAGCALIVLCGVIGGAGLWFLRSPAGSARSTGPRFRRPRLKTAGTHHCRRT